MGLVSLTSFLYIRKSWKLIFCDLIWQQICNQNRLGGGHCDESCRCRIAVFDMASRKCNNHDDVIKWKHCPRYWPFVLGIHRSPVNSLHKGQWRGALMYPLICSWINDCLNNREAGVMRRHRAYYDVIVIYPQCCTRETMMYSFGCIYAKDAKGYSTWSIDKIGLIMLWGGESKPPATAMTKIYVKVNKDPRARRNSAH